MCGGGGWLAVGALQMSRGAEDRSLTVPWTEPLGGRASSPLASRKWEKSLHFFSLHRNPGDPEESDISNDEMKHQVAAKDGECGFFFL